MLAWSLSMLVLSQGIYAFQKISDTRVERIAPLTIQQVTQAIELQPGYEIELVASEPLIKSPVAIAFDADGALWVVEMVDYSEQENDALGRLSKLIDTDGDGVMDRAQVVAESLSWPTALATLEKSVWVAAAPRVYEFKPQESGSPILWSSSTILEGLGRQNVQGLANSFRFGLDGRLHLSTSSNGGQLTANPKSPIVLPANPTNVSGRDIAFDLVTGKLSSVVGYGQHGMDFSPWGDRYVTSNSDHLQQVVAWYLPELTDASLSKSVAWRRSIAADGPQAEVFRISPVESWRTIRTQMRLAGISTGILEGQGRASGYFTSATGVTIYDGDQWPATDHPMALIADVGSNLVHRKRLVRGGVASKGERIDSQSEFLRSKDTWFRPVQFSNGPDGCLYIVDMARETIEHPKSIPEPIKSQVDLTSGRDLGRIWRVKASGQPIRRESPTLSNASTQELCQHLGHANGWHRETASQILIERQDVSAIPICRKIASDSQQPLARLHALSVLASLPQGLDKATWLGAIEDPSAHVRLWAWVFSNRVANLSAETSQELVPTVLLIMQRETDLEVQMAMAVRSPLILAQDSRRAELIATWLKRKDPAIFACDELRAAIEFAIRGNGAKLLWEQADWLTLLGDSNLGASYLDAIFYQMQQHGDLAGVLQAWNQKRWTEDQLRSVTDTLGRLVERKIVPEGSETYLELSKLASNLLVPRIQSAMKKGNTAQQAEAELGQSDPQRSNVIRLLGTLPIQQREEIFTKILSDCSSASIQSSVIESWVPSQSAFQKLAAEYLDGSNPLIEQSILKALIRNESGARLLLERIERNGQSTSSIPAWVWQALRAFPTETIKTRAQKLSPVSEVPWESVAQKYREAWDKPGDSKLGEAHFRKLCASCHRAMDIGIAIGPSLDSYRVRPNEAIALAVAEPSREMDPKYEQQQVRTKDGEVAAGILVNSSAEQISILTAQNQNVLISKSDVQEWKSSGKSLMPDGMLKELDPKALNDLIAFLRLVPGR
jgi:putative membrane-bound dehydrogenase-like protein